VLIVGIDAARYSDSLARTWQVLVDKEPNIEEPNNWDREWSGKLPAQNAGGHYKTNCANAMGSVETSPPHELRDGEGTLAQGTFSPKLNPNRSRKNIAANDFAVYI
jgi:hypothetical protein